MPLAPFTKCRVIAGTEVEEDTSLDTGLYPILF